jgi:hypothetical protein
MLIAVAFAAVALAGCGAVSVGATDTNVSPEDNVTSPDNGGVDQGTGTDGIGPFDLGPDQPQPDTQEEEVEVDLGTDGALGCGGPGEFLCPCEQSNECVSGYCVESHEGKVCTTTCLEDCPAGWKCVQDSLAPDLIYICLPENVYLCRPCTDSDECHSPYAQTGDACVPHGDNGSFCGVNCEKSGACPSGYVCAEVEGDGKTVKQCVPASGDCTCTPKFIAEEAWTECVKKNGYGKCVGQRECAADGLTDCSAAAPKPEECNEVDDNCDGIVDPPNSLKCVSYYEDGDGDGYGIGAGECLCKPTSPKQVTQPGDCNDASIGVSPAVTEGCNFIDDDCDGKTDESYADGCTTVYYDGDNDGYGDATKTDCLCKEYPDWKYKSGDCDGEDPLSFPGAQELCDGKDNNCDNVIDEENALGCTPYYLDQDGDSFGLSDQLKCLCAPLGDYKATKGGDCNDTVYEIHPLVVELCDGLDNDCDDSVDEEEAVESCGIVAHGAVACQGGCVVSQCEGGYVDLNQAFVDGCECQVEEGEIPNQGCMDATPVGDLPDGGSSISKTGRIVPQEDSDWYVFNAIDASDPEDCDTFHVRVRLIKNPNDAYLFDVYQAGCAGADNLCVETTLFEFMTDFFVDNGVEGAPGGECKCKPDANHTITPPDENAHVPFDGDDTSAAHHQCKDQTSLYYVRVWRKPGTVVACDEYQIEFSNGIKE